MGCHKTAKSFALLLASVLLLPFACAPDATSTTPQQDAQVVAAFEGTWTAQTATGPVTFSVCEDRDADGTGSSSCETLHVVRGGGRSAGEDVDWESGGLGCGGCNYDISAFFKGSLTLPDGTTLPATAILTLATAHKSNLYDGKYDLVVTAREPGRMARVDADYRDGSLIRGTLYADAGSNSSSAGTGGSADVSLNGLNFEHTASDGCAP
jgi:hypothetical protein